MHTSVAWIDRVFYSTSISKLWGPCRCSSTLAVKGLQFAKGVVFKSEFSKHGTEEGNNNKHGYGCWIVFLSFISIPCCQL